MPTITDHMTKENIESSYQRSIKYEDGYNRGVESGFSGRRDKTQAEMVRKMTNEERLNFEAGFNAGVKKGLERAKNENR